MPPKAIAWTEEQVAFVMERSTAGIKPAEIGKEVKIRWPDREIAKKSISSLIARNKKKAIQGGQASRETSTAPSMSARSEFSSSPQIPETPQHYTVSNVIKEDEDDEVDIPDVMQCDHIEPEATEGIEAPPNSPEISSNNETEGMEGIEAPPNIPEIPSTLEARNSRNASPARVASPEPESTKEPFPKYDEEIADELLKAEVAKTALHQANTALAIHQANTEFTDTPPVIHQVDSTFDTHRDKRARANTAHSIHQTDKAPTDTIPHPTTIPVVLHSLQPTPLPQPTSSGENMAGRTPSPTPPPTPVQMPTFADLLGREIITFHIGPKRKEFPIHGNLLRLSSTYFHTFNFTLNESGQGEHYLPDADPSAFAVIINWLYRQNVDLTYVPSPVAVTSTDSAGQPGDDQVSLANAGPSKLAVGSDAHKHFVEFVERSIGVYVLAEDFAIGSLKDLVMTALGKAYFQYEMVPSAKDIITVYSRTGVRSRLRKYMARSYQILADLEDADIVAASWTVEEVDEVVAAVPALFKDFRALNRKSKGVESKVLSEDRVCDYHAHDGTEACVSNGINFRGLMA